MLLRRIPFGSALVILLLPLITVAGEAPDMVTLKLPKGDPDAGRRAFVALSCSACHRVAVEQGMPEPVSATPGPTLGRYLGRQAPSRLAMSIFAPSHEISANLRRPREDDLSPMPDYSEAMTVRQFMDLVAYVSSLPQEKKEPR
jgi:mono/diheme cytochrome c family protein